MTNPNRDISLNFRAGAALIQRHFRRGRLIMAASGHWQDTLYVTGSASALGLLLGVVIHRVERQQERLPASS